MSGIVGQSYHGAVSPAAPPLAAPVPASAHGDVDLWKVYDQALKGAKYIDLTHARYIAICPPSTKVGVSVTGADAQLPAFADPLHWDTTLGYRVR